jgi:hypothetical protein
MTLNNLGGTYDFMGDLEICTKTRLESLRLRRAVFPEWHHDVIRSVRGVAFSLKNRGQF